MRTHTGIDGGWSRRRMQTLLAALVLALLAAVAGVGWLLVDALDSTGHGPTTHGLLQLPKTTNHTGAPTPVSAAAATQAREDALAAAPMPSAPAAAAQPGPLATGTTPAALSLPAPTRTGPAGVSTGYPQTPQGALAQLAAIDQAAMQPGSLPSARSVISAWAAPGGPTGNSWSGIAALTGFLDAAGLSGTGGPELAIRFTPTMGLIKGTIGTGFVVACVDFEVDVTLSQTVRGAVADCQRMIWRAGRWLFGPGSEPAVAPSIWPDTDAAYAAGYRDLTHD